MDQAGFDQRRRQLEERASKGPGTLDASERTALLHHRDVPAKAAALIQKLRENAYKITDEDYEVLRQAGYSNAQLFELTVCATLASAAERIDAGLAAFDALDAQNANGTNAPASATPKEDSDEAAAG
jgi:alkylhydroperoxidase family enzyme